ncbi:MAG TPA: sigma-70 family RNA polymerase sigma factor [Candidatus Limnocylindrales bacterium]
MLGSLVGEPVGDESALPALRVIDSRAAIFRRLVDRNLDGAYRLAAVILGDRVEAEDAVHDAAVAAWRGFEDLRDPDRFDAWFRRILVNGCRDRLRARARHRVVDVGRELVEREHPRVPDASETTAVRDALARALDALKPDEQAVVALRFHADLTVPAIAEALGIPEGTVKSRLHNAMGRLRAVLEEMDR